MTTHEQQMQHLPRALTIAGSDSGAGAGIQADLKTFAALQVYGLSAITAITAQNTQGVRAAFPLAPELIEAQIDAVLEGGELANYYLAHSARADMCRRLGRTTEARASYEKALALTQQEPERQFLRERIRWLQYSR